MTNTHQRKVPMHAVKSSADPGEIGALMRREGMHASSLSTWRRQREAADLAALAPVKRGPKADPHRRDHFKEPLGQGAADDWGPKKLAALLGVGADSKMSHRADSRMRQLERVLF